MLEPESGEGEGVTLHCHWSRHQRERGGGDPASPGAEERSPEQRESSNLLPRPGTQQTCPAPGTRFDQTCLTYLTYPVQCVEIIKFGTKCRLLRAAEGDTC